MISSNPSPYQVIPSPYSLCLYILQATGAVFLLAGVWIALKLHKYLELDSDVSSGLPLFFSGLGLFVLALASAACQCAVKGAAPKLYVVSNANYTTRPCIEKKATGYRPGPNLSATLL